MFVLAAALSLDATAASAQDSTRRARSTTRIPVTKEAPGEVVPPRVDTVTIYRTDTLRVYRTDTLTVTRIDTLRIHIAPPVPPRLRQIGGFYFGLALGGSVTAEDLSNGQNGGFHMDLPIGFDPVGSPIGGRFTIGYTNLSRRDRFDFLNDEINNFNIGSSQIWSFDLSGKVRLPIKSAYTSRFQVYGVGGASYSHFKNIIESNTCCVTVGDAFLIGDNVVVVGDNNNGVFLEDDSWHGDWGWNAGGGLQFGWGRANLYVESRVIGFRRDTDFVLDNVTLNRRSQLNQVPIVIGMTWY
jgi:hypothetical protein